VSAPVQKELDDSDDGESDVVAGIGWPDYMRAWHEPRWSSPPAISSTLPEAPPLIVEDCGPFAPPPDDSLVLPEVAVYVTSVVVSPLPKSFSKPGSGTCFPLVWGDLLKLDSVAWLQIPG
jgi:hypothetical protein